MTLSLKQKAMLITAGLIVGAIAGSFAIAFIVANVSAQIIGNAIGGGLVAWFIYLFYAITLNRLEYNEALNKINEKSN
jgi:formate/nitrite transporter FocA (FNT family)